jgi:hypothetical protein
MTKLFLCPSAAGPRPATLNGAACKLHRCVTRRNLHHHQVKTCGNTNQDHFAPVMFLFLVHRRGERGHYVAFPQLLSPYHPPPIPPLLRGLSILCPHGPRKSSHATSTTEILPRTQSRLPSLPPSPLGKGQTVDRLEAESHVTLTIQYAKQSPALVGFKRTRHLALVVVKRPLTINPVPAC